jgi:hypothetical protein
MIKKFSEILKKYKRLRPRTDPKIAAPQEYVPLSSLMIVDLAVNNEGRVMMVCDGILAQEPVWCSFDSNRREVFIFYEDGNFQPLGLPISNKMHDYLHKAQKIYIIAYKDAKDKRLYALGLVASEPILKF